MCKKLATIFSEIANAIRAKKGTYNTITPENMADEIVSIPTEGETNTTPPVYQAKTATENGTVTADEGYDALSSVKVAVPLPKISETIPTFGTNGTYLASGDGFDAYPGVIVDVDPNLQTDKTATANGTYYPDDGYDGIGKIKVAVEPKLQSTIVTKNGTYTADEGYDGLEVVDVVVQPKLQSTIVTKNGTYTADEGYDGLEVVDVCLPSQEKTITANGTYTADENGNFSKVVVNVQDTGNIQSMPTASLLIHGSAYMTGDEVCIPYYENGELKYCYGYETLCGHLAEGWVIFNVPVGALVGLCVGEYSIRKDMGTFEEVTASFNRLSNISWYRMTDDTEITIE